MSLQPLIASVVAALILSAAGMAYGAAENARLVTILSALAYAVFVLIVAWRVNRPAWTATGSTSPDLLFHTMRRNTRLAALVYAWAAAAFFAIYGLTGVSWQHGFQYGTAAALIAAGLLYYVHKLGASGANDPPPVVLTILHSLAVTAGLIFLLASGKLQTAKGDWPANYIFLFGGFAIVGLCYFAYITQTRRPSP
jgi:hypothetical protein